MIDKIKLSKDVTLITESHWDIGSRVLQCRLRFSRQEHDAKEEEIVRFEGKHLYIETDILDKYGIKLHLETTTEEG